MNPKKIRRKVSPPSAASEKILKELEYAKKNEFNQEQLKIIDKLIKLAHNSCVDDVLRVVEGIENPYPKDVFPEMSEEQIKNVNYVLDRNGITLDRFSAYLMRIARNNLQEELTKKLKEMKE